MTATFPGSVKSFGSDRVNGDYIPASDMNDVRNEVVALETAALGGWLTQSETWTYASANTFTVATDRTTFYTKGRRVRWSHGAGYRYGVIASSAFGAVTTVTLLANNDYQVSNSAITLQGVSDLDNPQGWPDWFSYTPTYSANVLLTYTVVTTQYAKYRITGRVCQFAFRAVGTLGGITNTNMYATVPVVPAAVTGVYMPFSASCETNCGMGLLDTSTPRFWVSRYDLGNFTLGASKLMAGTGSYEW